MYRWTTEFIEKNTSYWEYKRKIGEQERQKMFDEWDKKNRLEKIKHIEKRMVRREKYWKKEPENNEKYEKWREQDKGEQQDEDSTTNSEVRENREQNAAQLFPIFKKLREATKMKIPVKQDEGLVIGGPDMGLAKNIYTLPPKIASYKPSIKKPTEKPTKIPRTL